MTGLSLFLITLIVDLGLQLVFGVLSILLKSEKFYDLIGGLTHIICALIGVFYDWNVAGQISLEAKLIQALCICCWAGKLGGFLLYRVIKAGGDKRFDDAKNSPIKLMIVWILQGLWVYMNILPSLFMWETSKKNMNFVSVIGWVVFLFGLVFETVADYQKTMFRNNLSNKGRFISSGLWSISRHPNYFGEILLWCGLAVSALPALEKWQLLTLISPVFVWALLMKISGAPMLEAKAKRRWGDDTRYREYVENTPLLVPRLR